ncbi:MAG: hypothetical protein P8Y97_13470, partial [Candidatus Lokiarchaeota archaeon]
IEIDTIITSISISFIIPEFFILPIILTCPISFCSSRINQQEDQDQPNQSEVNQVDNRGLDGSNNNNAQRKWTISPNKCSICGTIIKQKNLHFCPNCGYRLFPRFREE